MRTRSLDIYDTLHEVSMDREPQLRAGVEIDRLREARDRWEQERGGPFFSEAEIDAAISRFNARIAQAMGGQ